jgi:hypothetical protein
MILQAFKFDTLSKIPEFIDFKAQLHNSIQRAITSRQIIRVDLLNANNWNALIGQMQSLDLDGMLISANFPYFSSENVFDNRDHTLVPSFTGIDMVGEIRGKPFPPVNDSLLKIQTCTLLLLAQILKNPGTIEQKVDTKEFSELIDNSELKNLETLSARIVLELQLKLDGKGDPKAIDLLIKESEEIWNGIYEKLKQETFLPSCDFCVEMTFLIEAWNMLSIVAVYENDQAWKTLLTKQFKNVKTLLAIKSSEFENGLSTSIKGLLVSEDNIKKLKGPKVLEFLQRGFEALFANYVSLMDGRLRILKKK